MGDVPRPQLANDFLEEGNMLWDKDRNRWNWPITGVPESVHEHMFRGLLWVTTSAGRRLPSVEHRKVTAKAAMSYEGLTDLDEIQLTS